MKITILALIAFFVFTLTTFAQNSYSIKGITIDTASKAKLPSTITILNAQDSILRKFGHSTDDGAFSVMGLSKGKYIVLITSPDYGDFVARINLDTAHQLYNFNIVNMSHEAKMLNEVKIKSSVTAIKIKGDTIEYNAKAYVIQPNDKVEDMLKQLPGIQIDKDGKITANGEPVPKVLLDGEEFFGDDPTLVTRNIRADMVDKIQLYDKKSDQTVFTGIDDGVKTKTINIKLKEDKKTGLFGKLDAGVGNDGYYEGQAIYNRFWAKQKFSVYGTGSNDGKVGLGYADNSKIGTSNIQISDDGSGNLSLDFNGDQLDDGTYYGNGLPVSRTGGVHYDSKWNNDKESINANYKIGSLAVTTDQHTVSQTNLDSYVSNTDNTSHTYNYTFRQKLDAIYTKALSPSENIKITVSGTDKNTESDANSAISTFKNDGTVQNRQNQISNTKGESKLFTSDIFYTKRYKKPGRTISWDVNTNYTQNTSTNYLKSDIYTGTTATDSITNQRKPTNSTVFVINSNITYSEPFSKKLALTVNYGFALNNSSADKDSYNQSAPGVYNVLDTLYSNDYKFNTMTNQLGAVFNYREGAKVILTFGSKANLVNYRQINERTDDIYKRNFINWKPQVTFQYHPTASKSLNFNYNGTSVQPTITQIQPLRDNSNPFNITIGNPNLLPSFTHSFRLGFNSFKALSSQYIFINGNYSLTTNPIIQNTATDTVTNKIVNRYVNLPGKSTSSYSIYAATSKKINALDMQAGVNINNNGSTGYIYNNNVLYKNNSNTYGASLNLQKNKAKSYTFSVNVGPTYTLQQINGTSVNYNGYNIYGFATVYLPAKFQISSDIQDTYKGAQKTLPATTQTLWNGSLSKTFFKTDNLKLSLSGNNLLNQDRNTRTLTGNTITQVTSSSIKRYFMFTVSWDFTKFGTIPVKN